ncbi:MAG: mechanosensitive ion channel family protein [Polyangiales bacterium]
MRVLLALVVLFALPALGQAQETEIGESGESGESGDSSDDTEGESGDSDETAATEEAEEPDEDIVPPAEIGRRIESTFQQLQELTPLLRRQSETLDVQRRMPGFVENVTRLAEDPALSHLGTLNSASLRDLEHEWSRVRDRLAEWQQTLEQRTESLTEARATALEEKRIWTRTRDAEDEESLTDHADRIGSLLERVNNVLRRVDLRLAEVLSLQGELSDQGIRIARQISRIEAAQQNVRDRRQRRDHRPLWRGWSRLGDEESPSQTISAIYAEHVASVRAFTYTEKKPLRWHAGSLLLLVVFLLWMRRRTSSKLAPKDGPSVHRGVRAHPIASALLLVHILAPIVYSYVPVVAVGASLILMVPAIHLLNRHLLPAAHRSILALLILAAASVPLSLGITPDWSQRFYILALQVASLYFVLKLWSRRWKLAIKRAGRVHTRLYLLLRWTLLPLGFAVYLLLSGYTERAELWTTGTLWVIEQAIGLFLGTELIAGLLTLALRTEGARFFYVVRDYRREVAHYLLMALRFGAVVALAFLALNSFDLLDPTLESSRTAFSTTFEFGSIELSFGSVIAFIVTLASTFLVMRLVHVLLEFEVLPRFELEQGISSAISLTASYVLVAIGVVLAFGVAGVGPERLALLGGALGVGIGFGLQNVVSNFVSGLILVAERPIKVGDVIEVGDELVGTVQRIGIRSSTVQSLDGAEVIVPNSDLVSGKLINWTLSDTRRRLELVVGAGYAHDPAEVMQVLRRVVARQRGLLHFPIPEVICTAFGDSSIDYAVRAWCTGYLEAIEAKSLLASAIHAEFAKQGIEIPFPQQDVHILSMPNAKQEPKEESAKDDD